LLDYFRLYFPHQFLFPWHFSNFSYPFCLTFLSLAITSITTILLKMRRINLQALLHTNETYESYLKRRLANVMTNYCEQQINECPATTIRLDKVIITNKNSLISRKRMDNDDEKKEILKQLLEQQRQTNFERIFTQANIVILNVTTDFDRSTTIAFVILRQTNSDNNNNHNLSKTFNSNDLIDAVKVKYVLSAQVPSLSRVLGGVRIERIAIETIRNDNIRTSSSSPTMNTNNNSKLYIILGATAAFLLTTYIIAAIKVCRFVFFLPLLYCSLFLIWFPPMTISTLVEIRQFFSIQYLGLGLGPNIGLAPRRFTINVFFPF
uniref:Transmembrane domain-containing protein n=1 Tax=Dracunculus medinensis TaxID=318479 RepID=A0A0N4UPA6_DRAME